MKKTKIDWWLVLLKIVLIALIILVTIEVNDFYETYGAFMTFFLILMFASPIVYIFNS